jgi:hypothetical protein
MSQSIDIGQTNIVIANIGATVKTKPQLIADYPTAKVGQQIHGNNHIYVCIAPSTWAIFTEVSDYVAYTDRINTFLAKQIIESGGLVTEKPSPSDSIAEMLIGALRTTGTLQEIDPNKYIPIKIGGQLLKLAVLRDAGVAYFTHNFVAGVSSSAACSNGAATTAYYSPDSILVLGSVIYTNTSLTTTLAAGFYSDNSAWYQVGGAGVISAKGACNSETENTFTSGTRVFRFLKELGDAERTFNFNLSGNTSLFNISPSQLTTSEGNVTATITLYPVTSSASTVSFVVNANGIIYANNELAITDGIDDFPGFISGQGTTQITITFDVGIAKGRSFAWVAGTELVVGPTIAVLP